MINEAMLTKMIEQQVAAKLEGNKAIAAMPPVEVPKLPKEPTTPVEPTILNLDDEDGLRLENMILKDELEKVRREVEEARRMAADRISHGNKLDLQNFLIQKYNVDVSKHSLMISPEHRTLTLTTRE